MQYEINYELMRNRKRQKEKCYYTAKLNIIRKSLIAEVIESAVNRPINMSAPSLALGQKKNDMRHSMKHNMLLIGCEDES